ncbi:cysteine desulfurase family protein [Sporosarcina sp. 179-K 3D1 HS]|uniref:cysteine desulfurase family protein n=1 Tax=Sporosarcina sp. 179-K 3D1 HS TaxID=3232169 RepID=UPI00399FE015
MIYFDNSATTQPDDQILESFVEANRRFFANPASLHKAGKDAEKLLELSRQQILSILGAPDGELIFTSGGTEANNLAVIGFANAFRHRGKHLITTEIEHPSIMNAFTYLEQQGFEVDYVPVDQQGVICINTLESKLRKDTILVSVMHVNNEIGSVQPIEECARIIHSRSRAVFHSDTVQSFGKIPVLLRGASPDIITISGHKIHGLKGTGLLAMKKGLRPQPILHGGGQESGLRSGTVSVPNAVALAKAIRLANSANGHNKFEEWRNRLVDFCGQFEEVKVLAPEQGAPHILSIAFSSIKGEVAVNFFQEHDIIVSTSSACSSKSNKASHVIEAIRLPDNLKYGVIRISFGKNNKEEEITQLERTLVRFIELLKRGQE